MENIRDNTTPFSSTTNSSFLNSFHPAISTRSIVAGVLVSLLAFGTLLSLGVALGGLSLSDASTLSSAGTYGGLWLLFAVIVTLFASSYFTARISNFPAKRIGAAQGLVVAAAFFGIVLWQAVGVLSTAASSAGQMISGTVHLAAPAVGQAATSASQSPVVSDIIEDNLAGLQLQGDPATVASGVASRLLRGDADSAKLYLSHHTNLTPAEIDSRITDVQARMNAALAQARQATAQAMQVTGWSLFATFILGMLFSALGGLWGARANTRIPMTVEAPLRNRTYNTAYAAS